MVEVWREFKDNYYISNMGRLKHGSYQMKHSSGKYITRPEYMFDTTNNKQLLIDNTNYLIDELVVSTFVHPLQEHEFVVHLDGDLTNSCLSNLKIVSSSSFGTEWRDIPGFDGRYQVSCEGVVRRVRGYYNNQIYREQIMKVKEDEYGYLRVSLTDSNKYSREWGIHQLVAKAFIDNPENKPTVNHIDGNKHNNSVNNLEWATWAEQNHHAIKVGLREGTMKAARQVSKAKLSKPVVCVETGVIYPSAIEAERQLHLGSTAVFHSIHLNRPTVQGYSFKYVNAIN